MASGHSKRAVAIHWISLRAGHMPDGQDNIFGALGEPFNAATNSVGFLYEVHKVATMTATRNARERWFGVNG